MKMRKSKGRMFNSLGKLRFCPPLVPMLLDQLEGEIAYNFPVGCLLVLSIFCHHKKVDDAFMAKSGQYKNLEGLGKGSPEPTDLNRGLGTPRSSHRRAAKSHDANDYFLRARVASNVPF